MTRYLYGHPNPHARKRDNGIRFHGYPGRAQKIRLIGLHTTESLFDRSASTPAPTASAGSSRRLSGRRPTTASSTGTQPSSAFRTKRHRSGSGT